MGIFADVTLSGGMTICKVYISPRYISANRDVGHYALDYLSKKGGEALPIPPDYSIIEFKAEGREQPGDNPLRRSGVVYDRDKPAHEQVYADLREKLKAGQVPWLTNVRNEDGSPFVDGTAAPAASVPEPEAEPEAPLLPAPDALMSDYGPVGTDDITGDLLLDAFEDNEAETAAIVQTLSALRLKHLSEQLNVERARLDREHQATGVANPRSASIDRLLGLLTRRGEV